MVTTTIIFFPFSMFSRVRSIRRHISEWKNKNQTTTHISCTVLLSLYRYSSFDGTLESHISYRWRFEISHLTPCTYSRCVYEGPNRVLYGGGGGKRRRWRIEELLCPAHLTRSGRFCRIFLFHYYFSQFVEHKSRTPYVVVRLSKPLQHVGTYLYISEPTLQCGIAAVEKAHTRFSNSRAWK